MSRDWRPARAKCDAEGACRNCRRRGRQEAAHVVPRRHDADKGIVNPLDIVPLCLECHRDYDLGHLDLLPVLTNAEQAAAVAKLGLLRAWRIITGAGKSAEPDTPRTG